MSTSFKTSMFGGFDRSDVYEYVSIRRNFRSGSRSQCRYCMFTGS